MEQTTNEANVQKKGGSRLQKNEIARKSGSKKGLTILGVCLVILAALYLGLCAWAVKSPAIWQGTKLLRQDLGGMTVEEATQKLEAALPDLDIYVYLYDAESGAPEEHGSNEPDAFSPLAYLGTDLEPRQCAQLAYDFNRTSGSFLTAGWRYLTNKGSTLHIPAVQMDPGKKAEVAKTVASALTRQAQGTTYELLDDQISITRQLDGQLVDPQALESALDTLFTHSDVLVMDVPYTVESAQTLTAQDIYDEVSNEVKNAGYDAATKTIIPEQVGAEFDVAAAQTALDAAQPGETVKIPATIEYPSVTAEELEAVLFRDVLGEARTKVGGTAARKSNVSLSAAAINSYVMNTGDIFSYNGVVGQRTAARGYKPAPAYVQGETVDEIGGGICQTSSTLYLACLLANMEITQRYAHRYAPSYIQWGMDATVSWGGPDYKFTNNTDYPIQIVTSYSNGYLTVKLLGTKTDSTTVKMTNKVLSSTNWETVYEEDETLAPGTEQVKVTPYTGHKVESYRNLYDADGNLISSKLEDVSDYKVRNKVIVRGPAKTAEPSTPVTGPGEIPITPEEPELPTEPDPPVEETPGTPIIVLPEDFLGIA